MPRTRPFSHLVCAVLLIAGALVGVAEIHATSERLGNDPLPRETFEGHCDHRGLAAHFEPLPNADPHCPTCLWRLLGRGVPLAVPSLTSRIALVGRLEQAVSRQVSFSPAELPISRGPPAV